MNTPAETAVPGRFARWFVWGVWAAMTAAALGLVTGLGSRIPWLDDWVMVPALTGNQPDLPAWLWSQHNEHRVVLPRLILLSLYKLTDGDFRSGMVVNVLALAALAFAMVRTAAQVRGRAILADAFFPIALLHWGHYYNLLWSWQVGFCLPAAVVGVVLLIVARHGLRPTLGAGALAGVCLLMLPLFGAPGLAYVPAMACWLGLAAVLRWRSAARHGRRDAVLFGGFAVAAVLLVFAYFLGYERVEAYPEAPDRWAVLRITLLFLAYPLSPAAPPFWPYSGVVVLALLLAAGVVLLAAVWRGRYDALALLFFLGGGLSLALGFGWGRAGAVESQLVGDADHYMMIATPLLCALYFGLALYGPATTCAIAPYGFLVAALALLPFNVFSGLERAQARYEGLQAFDEDLGEGMPLYQLLVYHRQALAPDTWDQEGFSTWFHMLHDAGVGPFRQLQPNPPFREIDLPVEPAAVYEAKWDGRTARGSVQDACLLFRLPRPRYVAGIRLQCRHSNPDVGHFQMSWRKRGEADFPEKHRFSLFPWELGPDETTLTVYVADTITEFLVIPDNKPFEFRLSRITLLVPEK